MNYVISNLLFENKVKVMIKELLPAKKKGQSLSNLEQNNNQMNQRVTNVKAGAICPTAEEYKCLKTTGLFGCVV